LFQTYTIIKTKILTPNINICILSGDGVWHVRDVDIEGKGCQEGSLWNAVLEASQPASFAVSGCKGEVAIASHLHDHADHVPVR